MAVWLLAAQYLLATAVLVIAATRLRAVLLIAPLDHKPFAAALEAAIDSMALGRARSIAEALLPAAAARLAASGLEAKAQGIPLTAALDETRMAIEHELERGLLPLRALGRVATPLAFITIIVALGEANSERGLAALQRGLPLRLAFDRGLDALLLGVATLSLAGIAVATLRRGVRDVLRGLDAVTRVLQRVPDAAGRFTEPSAPL